jgi:hypothetical protein
MKPGIYLGLPEQEYFAADALGSTDLKQLAVCPADWWAGSRLDAQAFSPPPRADDRDSKALGSAIHTLLLEGMEVYQRRFCVDPARGNAPKRTDITAMRTCLSGIGIATDKTITSKEAVALCREHRVALLEDLTDAYQMARRLGAEPLSPQQDARAREVYAASQTAPALAGLQSGGLSEVSVFWQQDGITMRARFDKLLPSRILDVKTVNPRQGTSFEDACYWQVSAYRYDIQAELYRQARRIASTFTARQIHGGTAAERKLLRQILRTPEDSGAGNDGWLFCWVWLQVPSHEASRGRALKTLPMFPTLSEDWPAIGGRARDQIAQGIAAYAGGLDRHGRTGPWQRHHDATIPPAGAFPKVLTGAFDD